MHTLNGINIIGTVIALFQTNYILTRIAYRVVCCVRKTLKFRTEKWICFTINMAIKWDTDGIAMMSHAHLRTRSLQFKAIKICDFHSFWWQFIGHCWRWNGCSGARNLHTQLTKSIVINISSGVLFLKVSQAICYTMVIVPVKSCATSDLTVKSYEVMHIVCVIVCLCLCMWHIICAEY